VVNSIPELELMVISNFTSGIGIDYIKKIEMELEKFESEFNFPTKKNP